MRITKEKGCTLNLARKIERFMIPLTEPAWEDWKIHNLTPEDPSPAPPTTPKKTKKAWRKKKTSSSTTGSPGMDESTST